MLGYQQTVSRVAEVSGVGLHTGVAVRLRLAPAPAGRGIVFRRLDLEGFEIEARARHVARVSYATSLMKKGVLISTTEHLLSALMACGVDNVYVELDNLEVPILDGSALPFVQLIRAAGIRPQRARRFYVKVVKPVEIVDGQKRIAVYPSDRLRIRYRIAFTHPAIGEQECDFVAETERYEAEIAPARTFGFYEEVEKLRQGGLVRGGSLANVVVLNHDGVMNAEGLRFPNEFCRHKVLDLIGDLVMLGYPLIGHVVAERAGHALHYALVSRLLRDRSAWSRVTAPSAAAGVSAPVADESPPARAAAAS
jgi:UDP-3-O-[3-hydroxymyristoyl] N-acetylglucosamine deacetylase